MKLNKFQYLWRKRRRRDIGIERKKIGKSTSVKQLKENSKT